MGNRNLIGQKNICHNRNLPPIFGVNGERFKETHVVSTTTPKDETFQIWTTHLLSSQTKLWKQSEDTFLVWGPLRKKIEKLFWILDLFGAWCTVPETEHLRLAFNFPNPQDPMVWYIYYINGIGQYTKVP